MGGEIGALDGGPADGDELGRFPAVNAEQRHSEAEVAGLLGDEGGLGVIARDEDALGSGGLDGGELGAEILVALTVFLLGENGAAGGGEALMEIFRQAHTLRGRGRGEDGDPAELQRVVGEFGHHRALEIIDEADAEDVVALGGDGDVGGPGGDKRDLRGLADRGGLEGPARGELAEDGDDLVAGDEFFDDRGGLAGLRLVVLGDQLELAAQQAAGGVELLDGELRALVHGLAVGGLLAGERGEFADLDGFLGGETGRQQTGDEGEPEHREQGTGGHRG